MIKHSARVFQKSAAMAFSCPPELLLRNAVRQASLRQCTTSAASSYRAAVCTEIGKPLVVQTLTRKALPEGSVRVLVHSAAVNFSDILLTQGKYQEKREVPFVGGAEFAGEVVEVGEGCDKKVGDKVFGIGMTSSGVFAEECICPEMALSEMPPNISYDVAASFLCSYGTAYLALTRKGNIKEGETVLVTAAAGAVGMAAVDLAANVFKCKVIGAVGNENKCSEVLARGASHCIVYSKDSLRDKVKEITRGKGADIVFDAVGGKVFEDCVRCIAFEGRLLVIGFASGDIPKIPANLLLVKSCSAVGIYWGSYSVREPAAFFESIQETSKYLQEGKISPAVGKAFSLAEINEAFKHIMDRKNIGKILIHPRE